MVEARKDSKSAAMRVYGRAAGKADEHLEFSFRQALDRRFRSAVEFRERQLLGERGVEIAAAGGNRRHRFEQRFRGAALRQKPSAPSCSARRACIRVIMRR